MIKNLSILLVTILFLPIYLKSQTKTSPKNQYEELGKVSWYRDYTAAVALAKKEKKNILILFQEVPGCATCRNYGQNVLTHPLMVESIENMFIPLVIYNNKGGKDKLILQKFKEPAWNNPVVRIVDETGKDVVTRISGKYSSTALFSAMKKALTITENPLPEYMQLLENELFSDNTTGTLNEKYFKMYCFWSGEKHFGSKSGVIATEAGFMNGHEVVKVQYNPAIISETKLTAHAKIANCSPIKNTNNFRNSDKDQFYYLQHSDYKYLPLSENQKTKINSALGDNQTATNYLSPKQLYWFKNLKNINTKKRVLFDKSILLGWEIQNNIN